MKKIFIYGQNRTLAEDYIRTHIKIIVSEQQLQGYSEKEGILIMLPQDNVREIAKNRKLTIIEV